jgi:hypothetical protein
MQKLRQAPQGSSPRLLHQPMSIRLLRQPQMVISKRSGTQPCPLLQMRTLFRVLRQSRSQPHRASQRETQRVGMPPSPIEPRSVMPRLPCCGHTQATQRGLLRLRLTLTASPLVAALRATPPALHRRILASAKIALNHWSPQSVCAKSSAHK